MRAVLEVFGSEAGASSFDACNERFCALFVVGSEVVNV
jgi:hypothetical protein